MPAGRPRVLTDEERKQRNYENKKKWYYKQMESAEYREKWCQRVKDFNARQVATN